jgi:tetratricopeptide (TPR) repeat protein
LNLGALAHNEENLEEAELLYQKSIALYIAARYPLGIAIALNNLGEIHEADGKLRKAIPFFVHSQRLLSELRSRYATVPSEALLRIDQLLGEKLAAEIRTEAERGRWEDLVSL